MPQLALRLLSRAEPTQVMAAEELIDQQLGGLPLGTVGITTPLLDEYVRAAQGLVEIQLGVLLGRQTVTEDSDLVMSEFQALGFVRTSYPVERAVQLQGGVSEAQKQLAYPSSWLQSRRSADPTGYSREVHIVPNGDGTGVVTTSYAVAFTSFAMPMAVGPGQVLRNYWRLTYVTGFRQVPPTLRSIVGRLAAVLVMYKLANVALAPGIASQSLSIDGLSQSLSASNPYGPTIKGYLDGCDKELTLLRGSYRGLIFIVA